MNPGRILLTIAVISTIAGPIFADWNSTHVFNPRGAAAREVPTVAAIAMDHRALRGCVVADLAEVARPPCRDHSRRAGAHVLIGVFLPRRRRLGSGVEDHPGDLARILGLPLNLFVAAFLIILTIGGSSSRAKVGLISTRRGAYSRRDNTLKGRQGKI